MTKESGIQCSLPENEFKQLLRIVCLDDIGSWVQTEEFGVREWDSSLQERLTQITKQHGLSNYIREFDEKTDLAIEDEGFQQLQEAWDKKQKRHTLIDLAWEFAARDLKERGMVLEEFEGDIESNPEFGYALLLQCELTDAYVKELEQSGLSNVLHSFGDEIVDRVEAEIADDGE
jgi:hypothetical protein